MKKVDKLKYIPEEGEVAVEPIIERSIVPEQDGVEQEVQDIQNLIDKFELIAELCDYFEKIIDKELSGTKIKYNPKEFPDVYMSMKRRFPQEVENYEVTYENYKAMFDFNMEMARMGLL